MSSRLGPPSTEQILGVCFFVGSIADACQRAEQGGLVLAPSGPGLADDLVREPIYRSALETGDLVLTDSGWLVLLWWLRTGRRLPRNSGLTFLRVSLRALLAQLHLPKRSCAWHEMTMHHIGW